MSTRDAKRLAFRFVLTFGIINLFADFTYEGARSITGAFLGSLGASAAVVGFTAGFGELIGYGFRSVTGYLADKTRAYWAFVFTGYTVNLLAVPALALAGNWPLAAMLIILERTGRAIRKPAVEAMLSHAGKSIGHGWVFGLNEALDQTGATVGPLVVSLVLWRRGSYHEAFAMLLVSALLCLATVAAARLLHPRPEEMEGREPVALRVEGFSRAYWLYLAAAALVAAGFADFSLVAFHFQHTGVVSAGMIPIFYSAAMATAAITALVFGRWLDRAGPGIVLAAFVPAAFFAPCVFAGGFALALTGMVLWGVGLGAQESLMKALLSGVVPAGKRSVAFGVFDTGFGVAWFAGSAAMGLLYQWSIPALIGFSVVLQLAALPVFALANRAR
jgi:MFS family permease